MLLDPGTWSVANRIDDVLAAMPRCLRTHAAAETHACVVELRTTPHETVAAAASELAELRGRLDLVVRERLALRVAAAGTHPLVAHAQGDVSSSVRYRKVGAAMRALARREPTMALHVHVAVPTPAAAVRAVDGLRSDLPALLALSANSPYWRAGDSGFASARTPIFAMFPRVGIPRHFGSYGNYVRAIEPLLRSHAIPDPSFLWWDARLQPRLGTVEVRIMDAQTRVDDTAALAALVQCLVIRHANRAVAAGVDEGLLAENRFLASRDGMQAQLIDASTQRLQSVRRAMSELLTGCDSIARQVGCSAELAFVPSLADDPGDARQRARASTDGLAALTQALADEFMVRPLWVRSSPGGSHASSLRIAQ